MIEKNGVLYFENYLDFLNYTKIKILFEIPFKKALQDPLLKGNSQSKGFDGLVSLYKKHYWDKPYNEYIASIGDNAIKSLCKQRLQSEGIVIKQYEDFYLFWRNHRLLKNRDKKRARISKRFEYMQLWYEAIGGYLLFVTLTFNDSSLERTNEQTRRRAVSKFLKENTSYAIANIDYGEKNEREHYHALVYCCNQIEHSKRTYGAINFKNVYSKGKGCKLRNYLIKPTAHATKESTKTKRLLYIGFND